jgi:hypothetical protein
MFEERTDLPGPYAITSVGITLVRIFHKPSKEKPLREESYD